jgi:hypothetical protein
LIKSIDLLFIVFVHYSLPPATFASGALHSHNGCQIELRGNGVRGNGVRGTLFALVVSATVVSATVVSALILVKNPEHFHFCDHFCNICKYLYYK